jgi:alpha-tubulin suppressor-like RCC1 family protein
MKWMRMGMFLQVVQVSCGIHHACALQEDGTAFTWGYGGYGRLGHSDQTDVWSPKEIPSFVFRSVRFLLTLCGV